MALTDWCGLSRGAVGATIATSHSSIQLLGGANDRAARAQVASEPSGVARLRALMLDHQRSHGIDLKRNRRAARHEVFERQRRLRALVHQGFQ